MRQACPTLHPAKPRLAADAHHTALAIGISCAAGHRLGYVPRDMTGSYAYEWGLAYVEGKGEAAGSGLTGVKARCSTVSGPHSRRYRRLMCPLLVSLLRFASAQPSADHVWAAPVQQTSNHSRSVSCCVSMRGQSYADVATSGQQVWA